MRRFCRISGDPARARGMAVGPEGQTLVLPASPLNEQDIFVFDRAFPSATSQRQFYDEAFRQDVVRFAQDGVPLTAIIIGARSSKRHGVLFGDLMSEPDRGLLFRAARDIFISQEERGAAPQLEVLAAGVQGDAALDLFSPSLVARRVFPATSGPQRILFGSFCRASARTLPDFVHVCSRIRSARAAAKARGAPHAPLHTVVQLRLGAAALTFILAAAFPSDTEAQTQLAGFVQGWALQDTAAELPVHLGGGVLSPLVEVARALPAPAALVSCVSAAQDTEGARAFLMFAERFKRRYAPAAPRAGGAADARFAQMFAEESAFHEGALKAIRKSEAKARADNARAHEELARARERLEALEAQQSGLKARITQSQLACSRSGEFEQQARGLAQRRDDLRAEAKLLAQEADVLRAEEQRVRTGAAAQRRELQTLRESLAQLQERQTTNARLSEVRSRALGALCSFSRNLEETQTRLRALRAENDSLRERIRVTNAHSLAKAARARDILKSADEFRMSRLRESERALQETTREGERLTLRADELRTEIASLSEGAR
eukprot:gnl/Chilomastix_cuspidata/5059.p2 GENE.gnl/Chilomastix_cuspidata/5059~~gnl/Chilomastix_cuspidata/5059.p2  ORF type:complete len:552 (-),score=278.67 gnl/Chilomastix_cuspidata/5059:43-1698(-)